MILQLIFLAFGILYIKATNEQSYFICQVDITQRKVEQVKLCMNQGTTSIEFENNLAKARGRRDIVFAKMHQLLEWREMLNVHKRNLELADVNGPMEPVLLQYMRIYEHVQAEKLITNELCDKKVILFSF